MARSVQYQLRRAALRRDEHLFRGGSTVSGRRQAAFWVLARSPAGLCAFAGAGADAAQRARKVCRDADDQRASAHNRRPRAGAHSLYRARSRAPPVAAEAQVGAARATTPENHRRTAAADPSVVPTFGGRLQLTQILRCPKVRESAKLG